MSHQCQSSLVATIDKYITMKNLDIIAQELFNKIRGRFPSVTIGTDAGEVTNKPNEARYFDFDFKEGEKSLGKVSISLDEDNIAVMYSNDFVKEEDQITKDSWYNFLKEIRVFAKKRLLNFDTRDITKSNLNKRDYKFLAQNRSGELTMESKMYGTSRTSYQNIGTARVAIKHTAPINQESTTSRSKQVGSIYIESDNGERFKYPFKHLNGARAMAMHVSEGGTPFDDFGKHITSLSEELAKLKKFKTYMGRSSVMAESLAGYMDVVRERITTVKKTVESLQRQSYYKEAVEGFESPVLEDVPADVAENWIDQLTIKQFNEELKDVFPYIYNLVSEATKAKEVGPEDLEEGPIDWIKDKYADFKQGREDSMKQYKQDLHILRTVLGSHGYDDATINKIENGCLNDPRVCLYNTIKKSGAEAGDMDMEVKRIGKELNSGLTTRVGTTDEDLEQGFEEMLGQFSEAPKFGGDAPSLDQGAQKPNFGQQAKDQMALNQKVQAKADKDLGDGFQLVDTDVAGRKVKGVLDTQSGSTIVINKGIVRSPGKYIIIDKSGKMTPQMKLGPLTTQAVQKAGLDEGNAYANAVRQAKKDGKKKGDKIQGPGGDEITLEKDKKTPLGEFILSYFDKETGQFPKGETAVLTMVEKDYGEQFVSPAKKFIEQVGVKFAQIQEKEAAEFAGLNDSSELERIQSLAGLKEYDDEDEMMAGGEFPKIRTDVKKNINGQPHIGIEYANGDMWIVPQASDGKPVFTHKSIQSNDLLKRQLRAKGVGFPLKYDGDYDKRDGKWMSQDDVWDYDNNAEANSPYAKAQEKNKADLAAAGVDFDAELAKAEKAGKYPDPRIEGPDDFMGYLMQKAGVKDNTPSRYQLKGFGHDMDDDGYDFKDTSKFIKGGAKKASPKFGKDTPNLSGFDAVDALAKQGRANVDALAKSGMDAVNRLRKNAGIGSRSTGSTIDSGATGPTID